jgi:hypothetical protein
MRRRVLLYLTLIAMSACNGDKAVRPIASPTSATKAISDGNHCVGPADSCISGNPEFFFLPPMVKNPSGSTEWNQGAFNPNLQPTVDICASSAATEAAVATASCGPPVSLSAMLDAGSEQYHVNWKVPNDQTIFYRLSVRVGTKQLGYADLETGTATQVKNLATGEFIPLADGRTLPIKFRVERYALCADPRAGGCTSATADLATTPLTVSTGTATADASGISTTQGISVPAQGGNSRPETVTLSKCPALNRDVPEGRLAVLDLPTFGDCVRVTFDPALDPRYPLTNRATVFVCAVGVGASLFVDPTTGAPLIGEEQEALVTMFRYDAQGVAALPHAEACKPGKPGGIASASPSIGSMLAGLAHGKFKQAASQALELLGPKPLYAAKFIDLGGGGFTESASDFQFALPAKMDIVAGTNNQSRQAGATLSPSVRVTDVTGAPVQGAVVHFFSSDPVIAGGTPITTGPDGLASVPWTIVKGTNTLEASGRGIASRGNDGPREEFDPYQPLPGGSRVIVNTGAVSFNATSRAPSVLIYGPSLFTPDDFRLNNEQTLALSEGKTVTVWDAVAWAAATQGDFAKFDAIIFPDENCVYDDLHLATANDNKATWSPAIRGPVVVIGTDPIFHQFNKPQAVTLIRNGINFAASDPNATGLYVALGCTYAEVTTPTVVPYLSGVGVFRVIGEGGLSQFVTLPPSTLPVMSGLTTEGLSNWDISVHDAFPVLADYPGGFQPLATVQRSTGVNVAYIIGRSSPTP